LKPIALLIFLLFETGYPAPVYTQNGNWQRRMLDSNMRQAIKPKFIAQKGSHWQVLFVAYCKTINARPNYVQFLVCVAWAEKWYFNSLTWDDGHQYSTSEPQLD
jgi:hypothetical protein